MIVSRGLSKKSCYSEIAIAFGGSSNHVGYKRFWHGRSRANEFPRNSRVQILLRLVQANTKTSLKLWRYDIKSITDHQRNQLCRKPIYEPHPKFNIKPIMPLPAIGTHVKIDFTYSRIKIHLLRNIENLVFHIQFLACYYLLHNV